jgi:hypothetical protein
MARTFHVLDDEGCIDKRATRARRLHGPGAKRVSTRRDTIWSNIAGLGPDGKVRRANGSIDHAATREVERGWHD